MSIFFKIDNKKKCALVHPAEIRCAKVIRRIYLAYESQIISEKVFFNSENLTELIFGCLSYVSITEKVLDALVQCDWLYIEIHDGKKYYIKYKKKSKQVH